MATATTTFTDDLLHEIFLRLPSPEALMRVVLVCKAWRRVARDVGFLRRFHALHPLPHNIGFLFTSSPSADHPAGFFFHPTVSCWSDAIAARDFSLSFLPGGGVPSYNWRITACHDGCILLRNMNTEEFMVANPLLRCYFQIPPLPADLTTENMYIQVHNFLSYKRSDQSFQVLRFVQSPSSMRVGIFSSGTGAWRRLRLENSILQQLCRTPLHRHAYINQSLYWITTSREHMVELDTTTMEFFETSLPADLCAGLPEYACALHSNIMLQEGVVVYPVSTEDGKVGIFVSMETMSHVKLWVRWEDGGGGGRAGRWVLEKEVVLQEKLWQIIGYSSDVSLSVEGASRGMVFLARWGYRDELFEASYTIYMSLCLKTMELKLIRVVEGAGILDGFQPYELLQPPPFLDPDRQLDNILGENP